MRYDLGRFRRPMRRSAEGQLMSLISLGDGSTLSLDFTAMSGLDSRFTFSRTTLGTYVGPDGLLYGADTSTSSQTIGSSGSKTFTLAATAGVDRRYAVGDTVIASSGANNMSGTVTSYDPATQVLVFTATSSSGSGTLATWIIGTRMARFDHDPTTLTARGLLIEASATNLCLQSAGVRTSPWTPVGLTTQGASILGPDGTSSGVEVVPSNGTAAGSAYSVQSVTASASTSYTLSVWIKPIGTAFNTRIRLTSLPGGTDAITATMNNADGTIAGLSTGTNWTAVSATSTPYPNGWYRIALTGSTPSGTTSLQIVLLFSGTGNGTTGAYFYGAQLETGPYASSYIPTVASTVQRATDVCSMTGTNFSSWYGSPTAFSMLFEGIAQISANYGRVLCLSSGANTTSGIPNFNLGLSAFTSNRPFINAHIVANSNIDTYAPAGAALTNGVPFKIGLRHQTSSHYITRGTSLGATNPYAGFAAGLANLYFGNTDGSTHRSVHYTRVKFWPFALSNAQLDAFAT